MKQFLLLTASLLALTACKPTPVSKTPSNTPKTTQSSSKTSINSSTSQEPSSSSSSESPVTETSLTIMPMNLEQISQGDYSSIMGTWRNNAGYELTFNATGLISDDAQMAQDGDFSSGVFTIGVYSKYGGGGHALLMIPQGSMIPPHHFYDGSDTSDSSRDRLVGTQNILSAKHLDPYYRVKTSSSLQANTGITLEVGQDMLDYLSSRIGDKGWSIVEDNYRQQTQAVPRAIVQDQDGSILYVYSNGLITDIQGQLIYIP